MNEAIASLSEELRGLTSLDLFWDRINDALSVYGVNSLFYGAIATKAETLLHPKTGSVIAKSNHTQQYFDYFGKLRVLENCRTFEQSLRQTEPFIWHDERGWEGATREQWAQAYTERDMGLYVGFTVPTTHFSPTNYGAIGVSMETFSPDEFEKMWRKKSKEILAILGLLDLGMRNEHLRSFINLKELERECLTWLAAGLRPEEIAHKLKLRTKRVYKALDAARVKLNASTRDQAITRALVFNVIDP